MKAPNKIWLSKFEEDPGDNEYGIFEQWSLEPISNAENEEYIRKDALIEWLENKIKIPDVSFINGLTYLAYQDVIEHINEM